MARLVQKNETVLKLTTLKPGQFGVVKNPGPWSTSFNVDDVVVVTERGAHLINLRTRKLFVYPNAAGLSLHEVGIDALTIGDSIELEII